MRIQSFVLCAALAVPSLATAQSFGELPTAPELSPHVQTSQVVGISSFSIDYSSPAVNEREIFGGLVAYGTPWRAGANASTVFTAEADFTFGGTEVPAGEYTLIIVPEDGAWTVALNEDSSGRGYQAYNPDENAAAATVTPTAGPDRERLTFLFTDTTMSTTEFTMEWAGTTFSVPITVDTDGLVDANIDAALTSLWRPHFNAARYLYRADRDLERADEYMAASIEIDANWWNHWFGALIKAELGDYDAARELAEQAGELGEGDRVWDNFYGPGSADVISGWPQ